MTLRKNLGSFKDPRGSIFHYNNKILRGLTETGYQDYLKLKNIINNSIENNYLIKTCEFDGNILDSKEKKYVKFLEHEKIKVISYPYEWSFEQLKDAALLYLDFQIFLLEQNAILLDGNAYNIQFHDGRPIFIDILSIAEYKEGDFWQGHKEFCNSFLNPLVLYSVKGIPFNNWYKGNLNGINTNDLSKTLNFFNTLNPVVFLHIKLLSYLEKKNSSQEVIKNKANAPSKKILISIFEQFKRYIKKLKINKKKSFWDNYENKRNYSLNDINKKKELLKNFLIKNNFKMIIDLGCNKGEFSELALKNGAEYCVGIDNEDLLINESYLRYKNTIKNFLPLVQDLSNPSPNIGFDNSERSSLSLRFKADCVFALAIIHHLVITKNIPFEMVLQTILSYAPCGAIEFISKDDIMVKQMLLNRQDIFKDYSLEKMIEVLEANKKQIQIFNLSKTRILVIFN